MGVLSRAMQVKVGEPVDDKKRIVRGSLGCRFQVPVLPIVEGVYAPEAPAKEK